MEITIFPHTYDVIGGHTTLSLLGDFLSMDAPDFGVGVGEIEIDLYFRSTDGPKNAVKGLFFEFNQHLKELPKYRFLRKKRRFQITFGSKATTGEEINKNRDARSVELFTAAYHEVRERLDVLKEKVKHSDDFDIAGFLKWIDEKGRHLPATPEALQDIEAKLAAAAKAERDAMDDWQRLGLDWEDFHPRAREVLDQPFFWHTCNDFAPNGNDTGADVLSLFQKWHKRHAGTSSQVFFQRLLKDWEVDPEPDEGDTFSIETYDNSAIGLAFAHLKLDAACPDWIRTEALGAIERQRGIVERNHRDWELFDKRIATLAMMAEKLRGCAAEGNA